MRFLLLATLALSGCVVNSDKYPRPRDLTPVWTVTSLRLLAIQAEPAEVAPGERATFTALYVDPDESVGSVLWLACSPAQTTPFGCAVDLSVLDGEPTPDELLAAGVIGIEPAFPPAWSPPLDALDGIPEEDRAEGLQFTSQAILLPEDGGDTGTDVDFGSFEIGYKRVIVSEATTPNQNPAITSFWVEGVEVGEDTVVEVDAGQPYELEITLPESSIETYEYVNPDNLLEERVEEPFANWYATDGNSMEDTTLYPFLQSDWVAPADSGVEGQWFAVVRDRRGGITWIVRNWRTI